MGLPILSGDGKPARLGEASGPQELVAWSLKHFGDRRMEMSTSFGMEGCALIDMYARSGQPLTVFYLDTMFFFPETYKLRDQMIKKYPNLSFVNRGTTLTPEEQAEQHGPELWKTNPDLCCKIRKVDPMHGALAGVDVWITALRRSQSETRANIRVLEWDWKYHVMKLSPMATWSRKDVWNYIKENEVPYNELHEKGYPTVGCTHCTIPVENLMVGDYSRDGRWAGSAKKECGLHGDGI